MTPLDIGLSDSKSLAASTGGGFSVGGNTYGSNPVVWIVFGVLALVGLMIFLKLKH